MTPDPEPTYPCADCGALRTKAQGGTVFTVCDECWDKNVAARRPAAGDARLHDLATRLVGVGPKAAHVSASECHEIAEGLHTALEAAATVEQLKQDLDRAAWTRDQLGRAMTMLRGVIEGGSYEEMRDNINALRRDRAVLTAARDEALQERDAALEAENQIVLVVELMERMGLTSEAKFRTACAKVEQLTLERDEAVRQATRPWEQLRKMGFEVREGKEVALMDLHSVGAQIAALTAERDAALRERDQLAKLLPRCLGTWTGGSGGHRRYAGGCVAPGVWDVGLGYVCDEHKNKNGGDDDAWHWDDEALRLRAEVDRLRSTLRDVLPWLQHFGASDEPSDGYESVLTPMYQRRGTVLREDVIAIVTALLAEKPAP